MEELRSGMTLEREVLEDARKKADKLLRAADQAILRKREEGRASAERALAELEGKYRERSLRRRNEKLSRLPLEKRRLRAARAEKLLESAMRETLAGLSRERQLELLEREARRRLFALDASFVELEAAGLSEAEVHSLTERLFPAAPAEVDVSLAGSADQALPALTLSSPAVVVRVSLETLGSALLLERRAELAQALLGTEVLDD